MCCLMYPIHSPLLVSKNAHLSYNIHILDEPLQENKLFNFWVVVNLLHVGTHTLPRARNLWKRPNTLHVSWQPSAGTLAMKNCWGYWSCQHLRNGKFIWINVYCTRSSMSSVISPLRSFLTGTVLIMLDLTPCHCLLPELMPITFLLYLTLSLWNSLDSWHVNAQPLSEFE